MPYSFCNYLWKGEKYISTTHINNVGEGHIVALSMVECTYILYNGLVWLMLFNDIFNNISVISWRSVLLVEETGVPAENHRPIGSH